VFIKDTEFHLLSPAHCAVTYVDFYTRRQASSFRDGQVAPEGSSRGSLSRSVENTSHFLFYSLDLRDPVNCHIIEGI
jgi:hypothetical protein